MIILNQNKNVIINFDSVSTIERNGHKISCYFKDSPCPLLLGDYPTDARAAEVLNKLYYSFDISMDAEAHGDGYVNTKIYFNMPENCFEMPEE